MLAYLELKSMDGNVTRTISHESGLEAIPSCFKYYESLLRAGGMGTSSICISISMATLAGIFLKIVLFEPFRESSKQYWSTNFKLWACRVSKPCGYI
jgi:hypothetical protein